MTNLRKTLTVIGPYGSEVTVLKPIRHLFTAAADRNAAPRRNSRQHDSAKSLALPGAG